MSTHGGKKLVSSFGRFLRNGKLNTVRSIPIMLVVLLLVSMLPIPEVGALGETIEVFRPTDDQVVIAGSELRLQWRISGPGGFVTVSLSTDGGDSFDTIKDVTNTPSHGFGWYDWIIPPNIDSTSCKIKVVWRDNLIKPYTILAKDTMEGNFTIEPGVAIEITELPDSVSFGAYYFLKWSMYDPEGLVAGFKFQWRTDDGSGWSSWGSIASYYDWHDPGAGYIWWTPPYFESGRAQIRISAYSEGNVTLLQQLTTDEFTIISASVYLINPNGGITMVAGDDYTIEWLTSDDPDEVIGGVTISYTTNNGGAWVWLYSGANDFSETITVPSITTSNFKIRIQTIYIEFSIYGEDISDTGNRIISSSSIPSITLLDPNPPVAGGLILPAGATFDIEWSMTGSSSMSFLSILLSTDNGATYSSIVNYGGVPSGPYQWTVPNVDTLEAKIKISATSISHGTIMAESIHPFYIVDPVTFGNIPPIANAVGEINAVEGTLIQLDGSGSYDPNGDFIVYSWELVSPSGREVVLSGPGTATPSFTPYIEDYQVNFVFELRVSDLKEYEGLWLFNVTRVSVIVTPSPPEITSFTPDTGWKGTTIKILGTNMMGAEILLGEEIIGSVPRSYSGTGPSPDNDYTVVIPRNLPNGSYTITLRTLLGEDTSEDEIEIFPEPTWLFDNGIGFRNEGTGHYSYPTNPTHNGRYKDVFSNQIYINIWVCIGIPYWTPWGGWGCLGYEIEQPICPGILSGILYGAVFDDIGENGECFGMSTAALEYYHGRIDEDEWGQTVDDWDELAREGEFHRHIQNRQGTQLTAEVLHAYLGTLINGLIPSSDISGMGLLIKAVKHSIDTGELGVMSLIDGGGHAVVPYAYEDRDGKTYFYVYDSNREEFTDPESGNTQARDGGEFRDSPPVVVIDRSGTYWDWSFEWPDGSTWTSEIGIGFVPYSTVVGDRTLPTTVEGIIDLLVGSATFNVEDEEGRSSGVSDDGEILWGIPDASPLPFYGGAGDLPDSYFLPAGNYTTHISGTEEGSYNWSVINNGSSAFQIENADVNEGSNDTVNVTYSDDNPYTGEMIFSSDDDSKGYDAGIVHEYGQRFRTFEVKGAELNDDGAHGNGKHSIKTTDGYDGLIFTNMGGGPTTFDVEFTTNVLGQETINETGTPDYGYTPTATRGSITVGPGETVILRPSNWLNLNGSIIILEGEGPPGPVRNLAIDEVGGQVELSWDAPESDGGWPVVEYHIYRGNSTDEMVVIGGTNTTTFTDTETERGSTYFYSVRAINILGLGDIVPGMDITIPELTGPSVPMNFQGALNDLNVTLTWNDPLEDGGMPLNGFMIYRGTVSGELVYLTEIGLENEFIDGPLEKNTTYYYQLAAVNDIGMGVSTGEISITVPPDEPIDDQPPDDVDDEDDDPNWMVFGLIALALIILLVFVFIFATRKGSEDDTGEE